MSDPITALARAWEMVPRAVEGGLLAGAACGAFGALLRWRRLVWAGFAVPEAAAVGTAWALGHSTLLPAVGLAGATPAWFGDVDPWTILAAAAAVAWLVPVGRAARRGGERSAAACFLLATTAVVLLVSRSPHGTEEIRAHATGSTLLFLSLDALLVLRLSLPPLALLALALSKPVSTFAFDRDHARAAGHPVVAVEALFAVAFLALVAILVPRVGPPFVFAYLTIPAAVAERIAARPARVAVASLAVGGAGSLVGAAAAVAWDLPYATAAIAGVLALGAFAVSIAALWARRRG